MAIVLPNFQLKAGTEYNSSKYDIVHQPLFQTPLFEIHIDDIDNRELEKTIYELRDKSESGYSKIYPFTNTSLEDNLKDILYNLPLEPTIDSLDDMCMWANISPKGSHMGVHNHTDCDLAGVYYVKVPEGDCGNIGFHDNRPVLFGNSFIVQRYVGPSIVQRFPVEGNMYLFPSSLSHDVGVNNVDEDRIAISFNLRVR